MNTALVWFRQDLRLADNPAWKKAVESGYAVIPVFIWAPQEAGPWANGGASRWWLHHALADLEKQVAELGLRLVFRAGDSETELERLIGETGAAAVFWNRCYEPCRVKLDGRIKNRLKEAGLETWSGNSALLREPWEISTQQGNPYKVYTPFSKAFSGLPETAPVVTEIRPQGPGAWPRSDRLETLQLLPRLDWAAGFAAAWDPTRKGGLERMETFLAGEVVRYASARDIPSADGTSRLSPYLHFGQIGPREVAAAIRRTLPGAGRDTFHRELVWREFAMHVLYHFPDTPQSPLQLKYARFPWRHDERELEAWQQGRTGYPIVDAGMRQLWRTGWMHNRVRMIVASFLVKHLLHSWRDGADWFWDTLVDADLASNTMGWQWAGGCGADAAPYFRIFNPITQGSKFDPEGHYIRENVPELGKVPLTYLHTPWEMPTAVQQACGCLLGKDYPLPVVDHPVGRARALAALASLKQD